MPRLMTNNHNTITVIDAIIRPYEARRDLRQGERDQLGAGALADVDDDELLALVHERHRRCGRSERQLDLRHLPAGRLVDGAQRRRFPRDVIAAARSAAVADEE